MTGIRLRETTCSAPIFVALVALSAGPAVAQQDMKEQSPSVVSVDSSGNIKKDSRHNPGRIQFGGGIGASNADYFRGRFDGVPDGTDEFVFSPALHATVDLWRDGGKSTSLTLGTSNSLWTDEVLSEDGEVGSWYESNNYMGVATDFGNGLLAGATYTIYSSPNSVFGTSHEFALSGLYEQQVFGLPLKPQVTIALPVDDGDGGFTQMRAQAFSTEQEVFGTTATFTVPFTLGLGWSDYYGGDTGTTGYFDAGLKMTIPLVSSPGYGEWTLNTGFDAIVRDDDLAEADPAVAGNDDVIYVGTISIDFTY